jgi:prepilin-type processing-associated H-X9-DG protein
MNGSATRPRAALGGALLALILASPAIAQQKAAEPLARYVPADGLIVLLEHNGLDARPDAWKGTAAYKMLNETPLGTMLEDIVVQLADRVIQGGPPLGVTGKEAVSLLDHLATKGFAVGVSGTFDGPPKASVLVIRDAARNEVFKRIVAQLPPLNEPAAKKVDAPGERKVLMIPGNPIRWWYEKDDAVFSFAPPDGPDPVIETLDGKTPSALKHPARAALAESKQGNVPVGLLFVDLAGLPPLPPQAAQLGIDGVKRIDATWGIEGKGLVGTLAVQAPRPRRGILALFDQPQIGVGTRVNAPKGVNDYTLLSIDPIKFGDAIVSMMQQNDPRAMASLSQFAERFQARTGLSLRDDLMRKLGPRIAIIPPAGGAGGSIFGMWFHPPDVGMVIELKDAPGFADSIDRLIAVANIELKSAGAMVPAVAGQPSKPGTEFAEFRRLKAPERGYVLAVPPSVLPMPAGLRPTILVDLNRRLVALAGKPDTARRSLAATVLDGTEAGPAGRDAVIFAQTDPSANLPELLVSLPSLVQIFGLAATERNAVRQRLDGDNPLPPFRLQIDPDAIPDVELIRPYLFPTKFTLTVDDASIRFSTYQAFPMPAPQLNVGMETPVLVALLLPAVQAAREAARRSQCVNNLKQIGLAMHNYHDLNGNFPTQAITDKAGKPLLSWRVAILPFLDQKTLYDQFHLDEPWDSPHNKELIKQMPQVYACPSRVQLEPGTTTYRVFSGPGALFEANRPTRIDDITDGTSNTLMVVESSEAVAWTKPDDLKFDPKADLRANRFFGAGSMHPGGFNALMADGAVRFLKMSVAPQTFRALITRAGGEVIAADAY